MSEHALPSQNTDHSLTSERYEEFSEALELLYIKNNLSGRLKFAQEWPQAAEYLFGAELLKFDREGTDDRDARSILEEEAEERRLDLFETVLTLEEKSADKGVLQTEYVEGLINKLGREVSLCIYAPRVVDRFKPPPAGEVKTEESQDTPQVEDSPPPPSPPPPPAPEPAEPVAMPEEDPLDKVQPISLEQQPPSPPAETPVQPGEDSKKNLNVPPQKKE